MRFFPLAALLAASPVLAQVDSAKTPPIIAKSVRTGSVTITGAGSTGDISGMKVPSLGRPANADLATILGRTVNVEDYRLSADGTDWAPAIVRARNALTAAGGGVMRVSTPGSLTIAATISIPKGNPPIKLRCDSQATRFVNAASLTYAMFYVGGPTPEGGVGFGVEGCAFTGANLTSSYAFVLENANAMTFRNLDFSNMTTGINSFAGYALTLEDITALNVTSLFYSSTAAHNFVARRIKVYNGGTSLRFDGATDNISIVESDFEFVGTPLQMAGGTALRFVGNYVEYQTNDPIYSTAPNYGADISNNWIAFGNAPWVVVNFVGGQIKGNSIYNQNVAIGAGTIDVEIGDNRVTGTSVVATSPYQVPTYTNSWKQQDGYSPVGFRKGRDGKVYLRGNLLNSTATLGTSAFTLPAGYRPGSQRTFVTANSGTSLSRVSINGDGQVVIDSASGAGTGGDPYQAGLDGISFEPGV